MDAGQHIDDLIEEVTKRVEAGAYSFVKCATRLDRNGPYHKEDVVAAILHSRGTLTEAARLLGRQRMRLREYIYRNPELLDFFNDYFEGNIDIIERNYIDEALKGDMAASKHILSTRGRARGYGANAISIAVDPADQPFDGFQLSVVTVKNPFEESQSDDDE